ncbi:PREDICTED: uncharacterized protein LOC108358009 [Rhagoletis zephyria]|uniref:uncharacterized protein LOC108358009 n=1 Tax=Rhagoletis zephyria TaxID=28612 RepID=UPI0008114C31|nr:PREDICTED: uncharacterized protein LOC108358009 [Rhagoletis zephyria]
MSRRAINLSINVLLLVGALAFASAETSAEYCSETTCDVARDQLLEAITEDYLKVLDYEMNQSKELLEKVLADDRFQDIRSEILLGKKLILSDFVEHIEERKLTQFPEKVYKPARFFHMFGKSLLYRELIDIVARLEPNKSRYDKWIEEAVIVNGLEAVVNNVNRKRTKLCSDSAKRIEQYVSGLPVEQRRKAFAQKMTNWALKMKGAGKLEEKMEHFREFLRHEYLETTSMLD